MRDCVGRGSMLDKKVCIPRKCADEKECGTSKYSGRCNVWDEGVFGAKESAGRGCVRNKRAGCALGF